MGVVDRPIAADHVVHAHSPEDVLSSCICRVNRFHFLDEFCGNDFCIADFDFWKRDEAVPAKSSVKKIEIAESVHPWALSIGLETSTRRNTLLEALFRREP